MERKLPPADFSLVEPLADYASAESLATEFEYHSPMDELPFESEEAAGDESERGFDDHADQQRFNKPAGERRRDEQPESAPLFQLDVLRAIDLLNVRREIKTIVERA